MTEPVRARMWESGGRWYAHVLDVPMFVEVTATSKDACLRELRTASGDDADLVVEVVPALAAWRRPPRSWGGTSAVW
jgi:hypothetical protein